MGVVRYAQSDSKQEVSYITRMIYHKNELRYKVHFLHVLRYTLLLNLFNPFILQIYSMSRLNWAAVILIYCILIGFHRNSKLIQLFKTAFQHYYWNLQNKFWSLVAFGILVHVPWNQTSLNWVGALWVYPCCRSY